MRILICTIVRNAEATIPRWWSKVSKMTETYPEIEFGLSVYENDSVDNSKSLLRDCMKKAHNYFSEFHLKTEDIQTDFYGSVVDSKRVENLAKARNTCFEQVKDLSFYDYAMSVEVDGQFSVPSLGRLFTHIDKWDILSGGSYVPPTDSMMRLAIANGEKFKVPFYDHWATRLDSDEDFWDNKIKDGETLFQSGLSSLNPQDLVTLPDDILPVYSTFNLVCLYRMKAITEGCQFAGYSEHLQSFDCDTTVICEKFRKAGYNRIGMMPHLKVFNDPKLQVSASAIDYKYN